MLSISLVRLKSSFRYQIYKQSGIAQALVAECISEILNSILYVV